MRASERRCSDHSEVEAELDRLLQLVESRVADAAAVSVVRWHLARAVLEYGSDGAAELGRLVQAFTADWPIARLSREWTAFGAAAHMLAAAIRQRLALDAQRIAPRGPEPLHALA